MAPGTRADAFEESIRAMPGIASAALTTGRFDYTLHVVVAGESELVELIEDLRASGVAESYSRIVLREMHFD